MELNYNTLVIIKDSLVATKLAIKRELQEMDKILLLPGDGPAWKDEIVRKENCIFKLDDVIKLVNTEIAKQSKNDY